MKGNENNARCWKATDEIITKIIYDGVEIVVDSTPGPYGAYEAFKNLVKLLVRIKYGGEDDQSGKRRVLLVGGPYGDGMDVLEIINRQMSRGDCFDQELEWACGGGIYVMMEEYDSDLKAFRVLKRDKNCLVIPQSIQDMICRMDELYHGWDPISCGWEDGLGNPVVDLLGGCDCQS